MAIFVFMQTATTPQEQFLYYRPLLKEILVGKEIVSNFAKIIGVSYGTMYAYLAGKVPDTANSKYIVEEGLKLLDAKGIKYERIS